MESTLYWNPSKVLSYNRIMSFIIGERGVGKTYGMKKYVINRFLKHGEQFIYTKRYKTDLKGMDTFFDAVSVEFPNVTFKVRGHELYINDRLAGWVIPLSAWQSVKSREFPNVCTIIYDEFMLQKGSKQHYMQNEPEALLNFMDTIIRNRDNARCVCLSNSVSVANPFFLYFKLTPNPSKEFYATEDAVVQITDSPEFVDERKKTRFGSLISKTDYGKFALGNEFLNDSDVFVEKRSKNSRFQFSIKYQGMTMGIWVDPALHIMYLSGEHDPYTKLKFAITPEDMDEETNYTNWKKNFYLIKMTRAFKDSLLRFDNQMLRTIAYDMFNKMNIY